MSQLKYVYLGKIVNTHGIKGEVRILSDFLYKDVVFQKHRKFYIGKHKIEEKMNTYRTHKQYDMVTFEGITDINEVLKYKDEDIYINRADIEIDGYVNEDLIGLEVLSDHLIGTVIQVRQMKKQRLLEVESPNRNHVYLIPMVDAFVKKVDLDNNKIIIEEIEGLIDED